MKESKGNVCAGVTIQREGMSTEEGTSTGNHNQEHFGASLSCSEEVTFLNTVALTFVSYNLMACALN